MAYVDTSLLIAALTVEVATERAQRWLSERAGGETRISGWTILEFSSGLAVNVRHRTMPDADRRRAIASLDFLMSRGVLRVEPIAQRDFVRATDFIDGHPTKLRAGDALHLAIAQRIGAPIWTLDRGMTVAAQAIGVACRSLLD